MRFYAICGAILMPMSGVAALFVDNEFLSNAHWAAKCPLFMLLAAGIFVNFTINIIQIINCSACYQFKDRLLTTRTQVTALLGVNVALGFVLGLVFGLLDPEDEDRHRGNMTTVVIVFLFVGILGGVGFACFNEFQTQKVVDSALTKPLTSVDASGYDQM
jgi:drug/metabolite transporter (DMT)-like permease